MRDLAELIRAIAWPVTAIIIFFFLRFELGSLVKSVVERVAGASKIKFRFAGMAFEMAGQIARASIPPTRKSRAGESDRDEFERLAQEYQDLDLADIEARVARRFELADRLGELAVSLDLPRKNLAKGHEGYLVALATAAVRQPKAHDLANLRVAAGKVGFKFTAYRLVLTIPHLAREARPATVERLADMLQDIEEKSSSKDDPDLQELVDTTRHALSSLRRHAG